MVTDLTYGHLAGHILVTAVWAIQNNDPNMEVDWQKLGLSSFYPDRQILAPYRGDGVQSASCSLALFYHLSLWHILKWVQGLVEVDG